METTEMKKAVEAVEDLEGRLIRVGRCGKAVGCAERAVGLMDFLL
jgi:hypothetical protein